MDGYATTAKQGRASSDENVIVGADELAFGIYQDIIVLLKTNFVSLSMAMLTLVRVHHPSMMRLPATENAVGSTVLSPSSQLMQLTNGEMISSAIPQYFLSKNATANQTITDLHHSYFARGKP